MCRQMVAWALHECGYEVLAAADGLESPGMLKRKPVELIVLDNEVPS